MVDSGNQISSGYVSFYNVYKSMVDVSMARPAQAEIQAYWWRTGNKVGFYIQVKNLSAVTLSSSNSATIHAIVYEDAHVGVTNRYARAAVYRSISNLAPTASAAYTLETSELSGVNWDKLHFVVLVDYRPAGSSGAYDMLQAATALHLAAPFVVYPETLVFFVDPTDPSIVSAQMSLQGASFVNWTSNSSTPWFFSDPTNGPLTTQPAITVIKDILSPGWQEGTITYTTTDGYFSDQAVIKAYFGPVTQTYLPIVRR